MKVLTEDIKSIKENEGRFANNELSFDRDREYWNNFYAEIEGKLNTPSNFACFVSDYLLAGNRLLELGCGNGRDSKYFMSKGLKVTGLDASDYVIKRLKHNFYDNDNLQFICADFVKYLPISNIQYDYVYSRFTLHAISEKQEDELLNNVKTYLATNGLFLVEARTIKDDLYGKGIRVNNNAFIYDKHYRRFMVANDFKEKLERLNFKILFFKECSGFSKTETSDPVLLRCIARLEGNSVAK